MIPFFFFGFFDGDGTAPTKPLDTSGWIVEHKEQRKKKKKKDEEQKQEIVIIEEAPKEKRGKITLVKLFGNQATDVPDITESIKAILKQKRLKEEDELMLMF